MFVYITRQKPTPWTERRWSLSRTTKFTMATQHVPDWRFMSYFWWTRPDPWIHESLKLRTSTSADPDRSEFRWICLTFWTRGTYYYVMEIDAVPRRTYYYVLDLHGFNGPAQVSVVHDWTLTWTRGLALSHCALRRKKVVDSTSETGVSNACVFSDFQR